MYIESQAKGQLGLAMQELSDMNPLPMNRMLERLSLRGQKGKERPSKMCPQQQLVI